ncbi:MAG: hypothetical protein AAF639_32690 [Chloroflexota bacterium]
MANTRTKRDTDKNFEDLVKQALKDFTKPKKLGEESPFVTPYLLEGYWPDDIGLQENPVARGNALRQFMRQVHAHMKQNSTVKHPAYLAKLIELQYFEGLPITRVRLELGQPHDASEELPANGFKNHNRRAVATFIKTFIQDIQPVLHLEKPPLIQQVVGRKEQLEQCLEWIDKNHTFALLGPSGIGKTTLASHAITKCRSARPIFWYTFHRDLNDQLDHLVFKLAYLLHKNQQSTLFEQLLAYGRGTQNERSEGQIDWDIVIGLIAPTLERMSPTPILCFDEVNQLESINADNRIAGLLEQLRGAAPILLMSQEFMPIDTKQYYIRLSPLTSGDFRQMLEASKVRRDWLATFNPTNLQRLVDYTHGNPRLLELSLTFMALTEQSLEEILEELEKSPSVQFVLNKIRQWLTIGEWQLLQFLSVFTAPVPIQALLDNQGKLFLARLKEHRLVQYDNQEAVRLLPAYQEAIKATLNSEEYIYHHYRAARLREKYGEYTVSLYHWVEAKAYDHAVQLWSDYFDYEMLPGSSSAILAILDRIPIESLHKKNQEELIVTRIKLRRLLGKQEGRLEDIHLLKGSEQSELLYMRGLIAEDDDDLDQATHQYREAIKLGERAIEDHLAYYDRHPGNCLPYYLRNLVWVLRRNGNTNAENAFDEAWQAALMIEYEAEQAKGIIQISRGQFTEAHKHYDNARNLAIDIKHIHGIARACLRLGMLCSSQNRVPDAEQYFAEAESYYERMGHRVALAGVKQNRSYMYLIAGQYEQALLYAEEALRLFEQFGNLYGIIMTRQTLGEACVNLDRLDEAETHILWGMRSETPDVMCNTQRTLGEIRLKQNRLGEAFRFVKQSIQIAQEDNLPFLEAYSHEVRGHIRIAQENIGEAKKSFEEAKTLFEEMGVASKVESLEEILMGLNL